MIALLLIQLLVGVHGRAFPLWPRYQNPNVPVYNDWYRYQNERVTAASNFAPVYEVQPKWNDANDAMYYDPSLGYSVHVIPVDAPGHPSEFNEDYEQKQKAEDDYDRSSGMPQNKEADYAKPETVVDKHKPKVELTKVKSDNVAVEVKPEFSKDKSKSAAKGKDDNPLKVKTEDRSSTSMKDKAKKDEPVKHQAKDKTMEHDKPKGKPSSQTYKPTTDGYKLPKKHTFPASKEKGSKTSNKHTGLPVVEKHKKNPEDDIRSYDTTAEMTKKIEDGKNSGYSGMASFEDLPNEKYDSEVSSKSDYDVADFPIKELSKDKVKGETKETSHKDKPKQDSAVYDSYPISTINLSKEKLDKQKAEENMESFNVDEAEKPSAVFIDETVPEFDSNLPIVPPVDMEESNMIEDSNSMLPENFLPLLNSTMRSLVVNPEETALNARSSRKCFTKRNETGNCVYVQQCAIPNFVTSLEQLLDNACVIRDVFIGICCPEFPMESVKVQWDGDVLPVEEETFSQQTACGERSEVAREVGSWPWMAPLLSMSTGKIFCGGVLINDRYVLTAAHCTTRIPRNQIMVRLGQRDIADPEDSSGDDYAVVEIKRHALYNRRNMHNDVALLKFARRIPLGQFQHTVCLPSDKIHSDNEHYVGQNALLVGWRGISGGSIKRRLLEENLSVLRNEECEDRQGFSIPHSLLCTEARNEDRRTCNADSGVPLVKTGDKSEVIGILSWDRNDCDPRFPTVFTRVSHFVEWIKQHSS